MKQKYAKIFKSILGLLALIIFIGLIVYLFPIFKNLYTKEGQIAFKQFVKGSGFFGILVLFILQFAQIFLIIVPGEPIEILAGMCYGGLWGTILIMTSSCIISTIIFLLVRKFGRKFVYNFCDKNKISKIEKSKLLKQPKRIELIMAVLFFIPGTPKDLLVYIAGLLPIKPARFIIISALARFPSVISSTLAGENLVIGNWKMSIILYFVIIVLAVVVIFIISTFDKSKMTKKALKHIRDI